MKCSKYSWSAVLSKRPASSVRPFLRARWANSLYFAKANASPCIALSRFLRVRSARACCMRVFSAISSLPPRSSIPALGQKSCAGHHPTNVTRAPAVQQYNRKRYLEVFMNAGTQMKENLADIAEKARDLSAKVKERLDETYQDLGRTVRRAKTAAEDRIEDVRSTVRKRPLTSVASVAAGAFAVGLFTGWLLGRKDRA